MNLLLLEDRDFVADNRVQISGNRFMHTKKVLRGQPGMHIACGRLNGKTGTGEILSMDRSRLEMEVCLDREPPEPIPLTLVLALPRPKMVKRILQAVASLGVKEIYLINSWRVEKSFWLSDLLEKERLNRHLKLGLAQARDTILPEIRLERYFTAFVRDRLDAIATGKKRILAHPKTSQVCPVGVNKGTVLIIGPEGGFIDKEIDAFSHAGFEPYTLGARILRVETAVTALVARLFN